MLSNYIKITLAVMRRRKFFTFIGLFGISFTLLVLILMSAFFDHLLGPNYPEQNRDRTLYIQSVKERNSKGWSRTGPMSFTFAQRYVKTLKTPEKVALATTPNTINAYAGGKKMRLYFRHTDAEFWEIAQFEFLEGRPYTQADIDRNEYVTVLNDKTRDAYFGKNAPAVGKTVEIDNLQYRVIGVVRGCPITHINTVSDVWFPYNTIKYDLKSTDNTGSFMGMLLAKSPAEVEAMQAEYAETIAKLKPSDPEYDQLVSTADTFGRSFTRELTGSDTDDGMRLFLTFLIGFGLLFMALPALNLANLNISRILERASEIGVRRACGASAKQLVWQFTVENILIALMGGALAIVLAALAIAVFNRSDWFDYADFSINWRVAAIALVTSVVFGLMSGVYPAWKMSKIPPSEALKSGG